MESISDRGGGGAWGIVLSYLVYPCLTNYNYNFRIGSERVTPKKETTMETIAITVGSVWRREDASTCEV